MEVLRLGFGVWMDRWMVYWFGLVQLSRVGALLIWIFVKLHMKMGPLRILLPELLQPQFRFFKGSFIMVTGILVTG